MGSKFLQMVLKSKLSSAEADSAEVFVPAGILAPDYPANSLAGEFLLRDPLSGESLSGESLSGASFSGASFSGASFSGDLLPGELLPGSDVLASGACGSRACGSGSASSGFAPSDSVLPDSAPSDFAPSGSALSGSALSGSALSGSARSASASFSSLSGVTSAVSGPADLPPFEQFALGVYPFLELQPFHRAYYRVLEAFAAGRVRRLIVTMPPQHGKSVGATTLLPAYVLGLDPDQRVAIASYSGALASKFNRRVQRIIESREYAAFFPATTIKQGSKPPSYIRTADEVEIIGCRGGLLSVGREGSLTGNRVDCFILDDLYKDALEANSPLIRANCWEWYTSVVRTRMHNASRELIVFTRWHEEDLIGTLTAREPVAELREWAQLDGLPADTWLHLNFEALKSSPPTGIDPRMPGAALWEQQQGRALLEAKRRLDPLQFESMYQGHPSSREGLLYGLNFAEYDDLPHEIVRRGNYTDTADTGDDYLCSLSYAVDADGAIYITDAVYTREPMEVSEPLVAEMLLRSDTRQAAVESNNGGRGFARAVQSLSPGVRIEWFHQGGNKEARILSNSATALHLLRWPRGWNFRWPELYAHLTTYRRRFRANRWHDAADVVTGIVEREAADRSRSRVRGVRFL